MLRAATDASSVRRRGLRISRGAGRELFDCWSMRHLQCWVRKTSEGNPVRKTSRPNMKHAHYGVLFAGLIFGNNPAANDRSAAMLLGAVEASCARLRTDPRDVQPACAGQNVGVFGSPTKP